MLQGAGLCDGGFQRVLLVVRADVDAFAADDFDVGDADEAEEAGAGSSPGAAGLAAGLSRPSKPLSRGGDDHPLALGQAFDAGVRVIRRSCRPRRGGRSSSSSSARDTEIVHRHADHDDVGGQELVENHVGVSDVARLIGNTLVGGKPAGGEQGLPTGAAQPA